MREQVFAGTPQPPYKDGDWETWRTKRPDELPAIVKAMREFAAHEIGAYKYALKAELQSRVNGTRGLEHLSFEDISEIIDTVK